MTKGPYVDPQVIQVGTDGCLMRNKKKFTYSKHGQKPMSTRKDLLFPIDLIIESESPYGLESALDVGDGIYFAGRCKEKEDFYVCQLTSKNFRNKFYRISEDVRFSGFGVANNFFNSDNVSFVALDGSRTYVMDVTKLPYESKNLIPVESFQKGEKSGIYSLIKTINPSCRVALTSWLSPLGKNMWDKAKEEKKELVVSTTFDNVVVGVKGIAGEIKRSLSNPHTQI